MQEKRVHPRLEIDLDVVCDIKGGDSFTGLAKDVSLGGMFIESTEVPAFGTQLTITADLGAGNAKLPGVVRWVKPGGFGVQFGLLGARETHAIAQLLKRA